MTHAQALAFAQEWTDAWNRHELEAILWHYADNVVFTSPFVLRLVGDPSGTLRGKMALRGYFGQALGAYRDLRFVLLDVYATVDGLIVVYESVNDLVGAEAMRLGPDGKVVEARCHYRPAAISRP